MNKDQIKAKVKKLLGNPVVNEAAGVLELAQGNYELNKNGLYVPVGTISGHYQPAAIKGKHYDYVVADDVSDAIPQTAEATEAVKTKMDKMLQYAGAYGMSAEQVAKVVNAEQPAPPKKFGLGYTVTEEMLKADLYPGKVFFQDRELDYIHDQRVRVLETVVGALLLGKDDTTYKITHANLEEASRLFHVRVAYYQDSQEYHVSLE